MVDQRRLIRRLIRSVIAMSLLCGGTARADEPIRYDGAAQPPVPGKTRAPAPPAPSEVAVAVFANGLEHPWGLQFLPDGKLIVTERPGRIRIVDQNGRLSPPLAGVPAIQLGAQAGLFDIVLDPEFANNHRVYFSYQEPSLLGSSLAVASAKLADVAPQKLLDVHVIFRARPVVRGEYNLGGRLAFGPEGDLFVTVGDRFNRDTAQNLRSDNGKVLRIRPDGSIPKDNPFVGRTGVLPEIYTYGNRNAEGLTFDPKAGVLWELEHGAQGGDEVNILRPGTNYGWPVITYGLDYNNTKIGEGTAKPGLEQPVYYWDPSIAPSGLSIYFGKLFPDWQGNLLVGALKYQSVRRLVISNGRVVAEEELLKDLHRRIRDVRPGPDGAVYVLTDEDDGQILKLRPRR